MSANHFFFFFQAEDGIRDYKVTGVQTCALPILVGLSQQLLNGFGTFANRRNILIAKNNRKLADFAFAQQAITTVTSTDRKSTRLNSSHLVISYAVFCLKKKIERQRASSHRRDGT